MWYLWCGAKSPLYGKDKMAFFERALLADKSLHIENYNAYYTFSEDAEVCVSLLEYFGLDAQKGHIINGHVPVRIKKRRKSGQGGGQALSLTAAFQKRTNLQRSLPDIR